MKVAVIGTGTLGPSVARVFSQCDKIDRVYLCKGRESSKDGKLKIVHAWKACGKEKVESGTD